MSNDGGPAYPRATAERQNEALGALVYSTAQDRHEPVGPLRGSGDGREGWQV